MSIELDCVLSLGPVINGNQLYDNKPLIRI
jgi:hypothetical protein